MSFSFVSFSSQYLRYSFSLQPNTPLILQTCLLTVDMVPVWIALLGIVIGIIIGWAWKPNWISSFNFQFHSSSSHFITSNVKKNGFGSYEISQEVSQQIISQTPNCSSSEYKEEECRVVSVTEEDFKHLCHLVEKKDGGPPWKHMIDRSTADMSYQCWQRDPETGPPQYCSRTVYENATPEMLRDFFWDDEFRLKWDDMITHAVTLEECPTTGTMVVHWTRKFPFFCSDREYIIGRRIWESGRMYYCVTKGVPCTSVPRQQKPRRVDLYYSSWSIQAVESRKRDGQLTACEVVLFHHEDMGIPWELAKFGVRQGMWGAVKKIERGFRAYQKERGSGAPLSRPAFMACINTKIDPDYLKSLENKDQELPDKVEKAVGPAEKPATGGGMNVPKALMFGGAVVLACSLDRGLLTKAVLFSVARRFANIGRRVGPRT